MKILGIDPGYAILGYGVIEKIGNRFKVCDYGAITTDKDMPMPQRLEAFSRWCSVHLSHFPVVATWVDNMANAGNSEILEWVQEHILNGNVSSIATMVSNGVLTAVKYVANAFIGLLIMVYLLNYKERLFAITRKIVNAMHLLAISPMLPVCIKYLSSSCSN